MLPVFVFVIPAKAGIQILCGFLDPGFRRGDGKNLVLGQPPNSFARAAGRAGKNQQ
jgi:hypothetical protein